MFDVISILTGKEVHEIRTEINQNIKTIEMEILNMDYNLIQEVERVSTKDYMYIQLILAMIKILLPGM